MVIFYALIMFLLISFPILFYFLIGVTAGILTFSFMLVSIGLFLIYMSIVSPLQLAPIPLYMILAGVLIASATTIFVNFG